MKLQLIRKLAPIEGCGAALILISILQICFWPCFWGGKTLLTSAAEAPSILAGGADTGPPANLRLSKLADPGAAAWQTEPWFAYARDQYRQGRAPLWDPYQAYGGPLAANMQSQPFYPLSMALFLHLTPRTYNFYILGRLFIAGICAYFYLRLFLSFTAAIAGGIGSMLTGYYILFLTMPHLSVETLLPAVLLAGEYVLRRRSYTAVVWLAIAVMLVFLGGMPESAFLLLTFATLYLLFRIVFDPELHLEWRRSLVLLSTAAVAGIGLASFLLIPFYEYMIRSSNSHAPPYHAGLSHDKLDLSALTYFFPLLFGPLYTNGAFVRDQVRNYVGLLSVFLIIISVACVLSRRKNRDRFLGAYTYFFAAAASLIILKRYGFEGVNWIGKLPFFGLVQFQKYAEPILAFCIWVLCAIGIERLMRREASRLIQAMALIAAALVIVVAVSLSKSHPAVVPSMSNFAIRLPAILLVLVLLAILAEAWSRKPWLGITVAVLLAVELSLNYIVPLYRVYDRPTSVRRNPYAGGAFVRFLQNRAEGYRVFGRNWALTPSWASVFQLPDIRDMDGLYYNKYFPFLKNFLLSKDRDRAELVSSFFGNGAYEFRLPNEKRLLQLSSVKYLITDTPFVIRNARIDEMLRQDQGHLPPGKEHLTGRSDFILDGVAREGLGEHPPFERLPYTLKIGENQTKFHFSYALNPEVFNPNLGDGVGFTIEVKSPDGRIEKLFSNYIDPKHNVSERHWMDGQIDLSRYRGQEITLLFSTDPGPRGNSSFDWAAWSDFRFEGEPEAAAPEFRLIYSAETKIYEYDNVLPRATIYYDADVEQDETAVLRKLADPSLDVFRTVVLDRSSNVGLPHASVRVDTATIKRYQAQRVEIFASLARNGILVLNDSNYPEWQVTVDGQPSDWFQANYLFRGVLLSPGVHVVRFEYRPKSFYWGVAVSLLTCGLLTGFVMMQARRDRPRR